MHEITPGPGWRNQLLHNVKSWKHSSSNYDEALSMCRDFIHHTWIDQIVSVQVPGHDRMVDVLKAVSVPAIDGDTGIPSVIPCRHKERVNPHPIRLPAGVALRSWVESYVVDCLLTHASSFEYRWCGVDDFTSILVCASDQVHRKTRLGRGYTSGWVIASKATFEKYIINLPGFYLQHTLAIDPSTYPVEGGPVGTLNGRWKIYLSPAVPNGEVLHGFRGKEDWSAPAVFAPLLLPLVFRKWSDASMHWAASLAIKIGMQATLMRVNVDQVVQQVREHDRKPTPVLNQEEKTLIRNIKYGLLVFAPETQFKYESFTKAEQFVGYEEKPTEQHIENLREELKTDPTMAAFDSEELVILPAPPEVVEHYRNIV